MAQSYKTTSGRVILPFRIKAGNSPHNNGEVLVQVDPDRIVDQYSYRKAKLVILRPVIDKLIFEYNFADCSRNNKQPIQTQVLKNADTALSMVAAPFSLASKANVGEQRLYHLQKNYLHNYVLTYKPTGAKIIIQLAPKKKSAGFLRCDLNPARLGTEGMNYFREFLKVMLTNDHYTITYETIAKRVKAIKRIDIAVDMLGVDASDLEGSYIDKDKKLKKKPVQNKTGRNESVYFLMPENDKNQAYWYNKRQAYKDTAKDPVEGGQVSPYGNALYTRYEYRIHETDKPISNLKSLLNHLGKVKFRAIDYNRIDGKDFTHALFLRYALSRTKDKALEMIPDDLKAEYGASYDKAIVNIWKPEKIWKDGWHKELISLGLLNPDDLKKKPKKKKL